MSEHILENNQEDHHEEYKHTHGKIDSSIATSKQGLEAVKWSSIVLFIGSCLQLAVVVLSGSVSLLSDTIHNFGDSATALPLGAAFFMGRKPANSRFTYGYGKVEDIAGVCVLFFMLASAIGAAYISIQRLFHPQPVTHLPILVIASLVGFAINEWAAMFRIKTGKKIKSEALIADGMHARMDGLTSLAVLVGALGIWLGYPLADPIVGLFIAALILKTTWESGRAVFTRLMDGIEPGMMNDIKIAAEHVEGVKDITDTRVRWIGHRLHVELNVAVDPTLSVAKGHAIAKNVQHELSERLPNLSTTSIHIDPTSEAGEQHHNMH
jgi:cation diffusion facilitator family transporter